MIYCIDVCDMCIGEYKHYIDSDPSPNRSTRYLHLYGNMPKEYNQSAVYQGRHPVQCWYILKVVFPHSERLDALKQLHTDVPVITTLRAYYM